jgi:hypothetical protein
MLVLLDFGLVKLVAFNSKVNMFEVNPPIIGISKIPW